MALVGKFWDPVVFSKRGDVDIPVEALGNTQQRCGCWGVFREIKSVPFAYNNRFGACIGENCRVQGFVEFADLVLFHRDGAYIKAYMACYRDLEVFSCAIDFLFTAGRNEASGC